MRFRLPSLLSLLLVAVLTAGADGCSSDPNVEGAKLNLASQDYDGALANVNTALEANPENVEALTLKAQILSVKMEAVPFVQRAALLPELEQSIASARTLAPEDEDVLRVREIAWVTVMNTGNTPLRDNTQPASETIPFFQSAVELEPDSLSGHFSLGLANLIAGNNEPAVAPFERVLAEDPTDANAYIYLSKAYLGLDRGAEAVDLLQTALAEVPATDPDRERLEQEYLNTLASSGQTERAIAEFESRLESNGNDPLVRYNYATLLLGVERFEEAVEQLGIATELQPDNADAFYNLGVAHLRIAGQIEAEANALGLDAPEEQYNALIAQRDEQIEASLEALTTARGLAGGDGEAAVCSTLLTIYSSLGLDAEAEEAAACAGVEQE